MKREPKYGEWWRCRIAGYSDIKCVMCYDSGPNPLWEVAEGSFSSDVTPIAPIASHELVTEMVEALKMTKNKLDAVYRFAGYEAGPIAELDTLLALSRSNEALAKARAAGLDVQS